MLLSTQSDLYNQSKSTQGKTPDLFKALRNGLGWLLKAPVRAKLTEERLTSAVGLSWYHSRQSLSLAELFSHSIESVLYQLLLAALFKKCLNIVEMEPLWCHKVSDTTPSASLLAPPSDRCVFMQTYGWSNKAEEGGSFCRGLKTEGESEK